MYYIDHRWGGTILLLETALRLGSDKGSHHDILYTIVDIFICISKYTYMHRNTNMYTQR